MAKYSIGIDPGVRNLGAALMCQEDSGAIIKVAAKTFEPMKSDLERFPEQLQEWAMANLGATLRYKVSEVVIERYVPYNGVYTTEAEHVTSLIGMLRMSLYSSTGVVPHMTRAVDWKIAIAKHLFKQGFRNPSVKLDKKFSLAAAEFISNSTFGTDHEADASCLGSLPFLIPGFRYSSFGGKQSSC